jgi:hypothetical protein
MIECQYYSDGIRQVSQLQGRQMGAKTCLLAHADRNAREILAIKPELDEAATAVFVASYFPRMSAGTPSEASLLSTYVREDTVVAGCFPGLRIVAASEVAIDRPSQLPSRLIAEKGTTYLHAMHSAVDWFAFAVWEDGVLKRSLSVAPDEGIIEDVGHRLPFEIPYWDGAHPAVDPEDEEDSYPLPFHPLELGEAALREFFGFQLEGYIDDALLQPEQIRMLQFDAAGKSNGRSDSKKPWWKLWS